MCCPGAVRAAPGVGSRAPSGRLRRTDGVRSHLYRWLGGGPARGLSFRLDAAPANAISRGFGFVVRAPGLARAHSDVSVEASLLFAKTDPLKNAKRVKSEHHRLLIWLGYEAHGALRNPP